VRHDHSHRGEIAERDQADSDAKRKATHGPTLGPIGCGSGVTIGGGDSPGSPKSGPVGGTTGSVGSSAERSQRGSRLANRGR
jgi:hypothetical protein